MILFINCRIKLKRYIYYVHSLACENNKSWIVCYVTIRITINTLFIHRIGIQIPRARKNVIGIAKSILWYIFFRKKKLYIFFSRVVKIYYVNQLSAERVVRAMRCCHEMRVRANVAIVFRCARVYSYCQSDFFCIFWNGTRSKSYSRVLQRIRTMLNRL